MAVIYDTKIIKVKLSAVFSGFALDCDGNIVESSSGWERLKIESSLYYHLYTPDANEPSEKVQGTVKAAVRGVFHADVLENMMGRLKQHFAGKCVLFA